MSADKKDYLGGDELYNLDYAMIHKQIAEIAREKPLSATAWQVAIFYALNCNTQTGAIRVVTIAFLAEATGRTTRSIYRALAELEERGVMTFSETTQLRGRHPYVALSGNISKAARERGQNPDRHAVTKFKRQRQILQAAYGIPAEQMDDAKVKELITALKIKLSDDDNN